MQFTKQFSTSKQNSPTYIVESFIVVVEYPLFKTHSGGAHYCPNHFSLTPAAANSIKVERARKKCMQYFACHHRGARRNILL